MDPQHAEPDAPSLLSALAGGNRIAILGLLHQRALEAAQGRCSLLFERNPRDQSLRATSGHGLDQLDSSPWRPSPSEQRLIASAGRSGAAAVSTLGRRMPALFARLGTPAALLVPLADHREQVGLLVIGLDADAPPAAPSLAREVAPAFILALELARLREREELEREVRTLLEAFSTRVATTLDLQRALEPLCVDAARLFAADRMSVWLHDRDARTLELKASSDSARQAGAPTVRADDPLEPAAAALRSLRAGLSTSADTPTSTLTVPLRGCRRALGTVVFDGVRVDAGDDLNLLDRADELGRQLSGAVESVQLLEAVLQARRELEQVFTSIAHLVAVVDADGRIVRANAAFAAAAGRPAESLRQQPLGECVGPELVGWLRELQGTLTMPAVRELRDSVLGGPYLVTVTDLQRDGTRHAGRVIVARDLLPLVAERERDTLKSRLVQSEKLAALGQLVAGIAHEMNNPLQSVLGHIELLRSTGRLPPTVRRELQTVYRSADRAAKIVRNLLVFAGSRRLQRRRISLNGVLQKVLLRRRQPLAARGIEVVRHYDQQLPRVMADPLLLHQVFLNIVANAEDAVATAGAPARIELRTGMLHGGRTLLASVRDSGHGLAEADLPRVFEPFYTTKPVGQGAGLGLAIAYGIVQEHGGRIYAENHPDGGAVFTVELPIGYQHD